MSVARARQVLLLACAAAALAAGSCRAPVRGNGWNVLLVTIETTRADHLGSYGYARDTSPRIDGLAREGVLFEHASTVSPRTNPSLASLMTSRYPHEHGVRNLLLPLEPDNRTLAEVLHAAGYLTAAVQTHPRLVRSSGFEQGFDTYDDDYAAHPLAPQACAVASKWIRDVTRRGRPWFLWIHLMDPHWTYDPPPEWRTRFGPPDPRPERVYQEIAARERTMGSVVFRNRMPPDEVEAFIDLYDAEIRFTDDAVGKLLDTVDGLGLRGRTLVIVTADHGESLGEHDYFFEHGDLGSEPEIHVPLVIAAPARARGGRRVPWTVESLDVAPTVLDLLSLAPDAAFRGRSLTPLFEGRGAGDRPCFGETGKKFHDENDRREVEGVAGKWRWLRRGRFKMLHVPRAGGVATRTLYDLEADPGETVDATAEHPDVAERLGRELSAWMAEDTETERPYHIGPGIREQLRSLGYVD